MRKIPQYDFSVIPGHGLTKTVAGELSALFSSSYGKWSLHSPCNPGKRIKLPPSYYLANYAREPYQIAICHDRGHLVAQAIYVDKLTVRGRVSLVVQLVVDEEYRRQGIATALLHAIWGFSDYYAWGIVTSSPCTVEALEGATFRLCCADIISRRALFIRKSVLSEIPFLRNAKWLHGTRNSQIDSGFFTDRQAKPLARRRVESRLGRLPEGSEWLALAFRDQALDHLEAYSQIVGCSGEFVSEAYRRMPQARQGWARQTKREIDLILRWLPATDRKTFRICDFGAGSGRHMAEFMRRGYRHVEGIDFAPTREGVRIGVRRADCRTWRSKNRFNLILCLYDVIGSFPDDESNAAIVRNIVRHLAPGGHAVLSVSNVRYRKTAALPLLNGRDRSKFLRSIFRLRPSKVMSTTGEFFDARTSARDAAGRVYHKEQFPAEASRLPGEYLVVDRRYTSGEIQRILNDAGLKVVLRRFVRSGFGEEFSESDGKEILVIANSDDGRR